MSKKTKKEVYGLEDVASGAQLARLVLEMVGELHERGYESLYIDPIMAPSGCYWRYEIGAMFSGQWPNNNLPSQGEVPQPIRGSISDNPKWMVSWSEPTDSLKVLVNGFINTFPELLKKAREPNEPYIDWFKKILRITSPNDTFIFWYDGGPCHHYAMSTSGDFIMPMPPGYVSQDISFLKIKTKKGFWNLYKICVPSTGVKDWQPLLADPVKHWKTGCSARAMAYSWEEAEGFPVEISRLFRACSTPSFRQIEPLLAIPEHKVPLPGGATESQNDAFVLARTPDGLVAITVEGKVSEPFGPTLGEWYHNPSRGKKTRLGYLLKLLDLGDIPPPNIRYQLLHRAASAVIEARNYHANTAVMIVHSFSQTNEWFEDYSSFVNLYGKTADIGKLVKVATIDSIDLYLGWAKGDACYLLR